MKKTFRKITSLLTAFSVAASGILLLEINSSAAGADYVALGDSISYGYTLPEPSEQSYPALISKANEFSLTNLSVVGMTSAELLDMINAGSADKELAQAEVRTVSIGSNDLLGPFMGYVAEALGAEGGSGEQILAKVNELTSQGLAGLFAINNALTKLNTLTKDNPELYGFCDEFGKETLPALITVLKEKAPDAQLYISDLYNPFIDASAVGLGDMAEPYIQYINTYFTTTSEDYTLFSVYDEFEQGGLTNVKVDLSDTSSINFDPHPTTEGQKTFEAAFAEVYVPVVIKKGDFNNDKAINCADYKKLQSFVLGADNEINNDGMNDSEEIDVLDSVILKRELIEVNE